MLVCCVVNRTSKPISSLVSFTSDFSPVILKQSPKDARKVLDLTSNRKQTHAEYCCGRHTNRADAYLYTELIQFFQEKVDVAPFFRVRILAAPSVEKDE